MRDRSTKILAVLMVSLMAVVALAPLAGEESDATETRPLTIYGSGSNTNGLLGISSTSTLTEIMETPVIDVISGYYLTIFLTSSGEVYACGRNTQLIFGDDASTTISTPTKISGNLTNIVKVVDGSDGVAFLTDDGEVYGYGINSKGFLGMGNANPISAPTRLYESLGAINDIQVSYKSIFIETSDHRLFGCGLNDSGQLATGDKTDRSTPVQIGSTYGNIVGFSAAGRTLIFWTADGTYGVGENGYGQLGTGNTTDQTSIVTIRNDLEVTNVINTGNTTFLFTENGLYASGRTKTSLGLNSTVADTPQNTFVEILSSLNKTIVGIAENDTGRGHIYIASDGSAYGAGTNGGAFGTGDTIDLGEITELFTDLKPISKIVCCESGSTLIVTENNELYGCGSNTGNQLTNNGAQAVLTPINLSSNLGRISVINGYGPVIFAAASSNNTVTIGVNNNSYGSVSEDTITAEYGSEISATGNVLTIGSDTVTATPAAATSSTQYAFESWSGIPADGLLTDDITITANFSASAILTVTLDAGKGTVSSSSLTVVEGQPIGDLPTPTPKAGYTFTGWFDSEGNEVTSETIVTETESFTLYAQYELDDSLKPVKAMTDLLPLIFVVGIIILMIGTAFYYYRP